MGGSKKTETGKELTASRGKKSCVANSRGKYVKEKRHTKVGESFPCQQKPRFVLRRLYREYRIRRSDLQKGAGEQRKVTSGEQSGAKRTRWSGADYSGWHEVAPHLGVLVGVGGGGYRTKKTEYLGFDDVGMSEDIAQSYTGRGQVIEREGEKGMVGAKKTPAANQAIWGTTCRSRGKKTKPKKGRRKEGKRCVEEKSREKG